MFEFRRLYCAHVQKLHAPFPFDGLLVSPTCKFTHTTHTHMPHMHTRHHHTYMDTYMHKHTHTHTHMHMHTHTCTRTHIHTHTHTHTHAQAVLSIAAPTCSECTDRTEANSSLISEVLYCFLQSTNCSLFRSILIPQQADLLCKWPNCYILDHLQQSQVNHSTKIVASFRCVDRCESVNCATGMEYCNRILLHPKQL